MVLVGCVRQLRELRWSPENRSGVDVSRPPSFVDTDLLRGEFGVSCPENLAMTLVYRFHGLLRDVCREWAWHQDQRTCHERADRKSLHFRHEFDLSCLKHTSHTA